MHLSSLCQYVQVLPVKLSPLVGLGVSATCGFDQSCADAPRSCCRCSFSGVGAENTLRHKCMLKGTQPASLQTCHMSGQHSHMCSEKATKHSPHTSLGTTQDGRSPSLSVRPTGLLRCLLKHPVQCSLSFTRTCHISVQTSLMLCI